MRCAPFDRDAYVKTTMNADQSLAAATAAAAGGGQRSYQDLDPDYEWVREKLSDTLLLDLPEFSKDDMKVQFDNNGHLRISGERHVRGNRWLRFRREFRLPDQCDVNRIRARLENGLLYVILPKLIDSVRPEEKTTPIQEPPTPPPTPTQPPVSRPGEGPGERDGDKKEESLLPALSKNGAENPNQATASLPPWRSKRSQLIVNVVVALMVLAGLGMYAVRRHGKD